MTVVLMANPGACAIFIEAPGGGDPENPSSLCNRPFVNPMGWVDNILFHSDFNYYGVAAANLAVNINHAAVAGATYVRPYATVINYGQAVTTDHVLLTHGLGYVPLFFVAYNGQMIPHGTAIQLTGGAGRLVSAYATTSQIILRDLGISSASDLPAFSAQYQVLVFRDVAADPSLPMLNIEPGQAIFGQGKFRQAQAHLRAMLSGDTPFAQAMGPTAGIRNGSLRTWRPNGTVADLGTYTGSLPMPTFVNLTAGL